MKAVPFGHEKVMAAIEAAMKNEFATESESAAREMASVSSLFATAEAADASSLYGTPFMVADDSAHRNLGQAGLLRAG